MTSPADLVSQLISMQGGHASPQHRRLHRDKKTLNFSCCRTAASSRAVQGGGSGGAAAAAAATSRPCPSVIHLAPEIEGNACGFISRLALIATCRRKPGYWHTIANINASYELIGFESWLTNFLFEIHPARWQRQKYAGKY